MTLNQMIDTFNAWSKEAWDASAAARRAKIQSRKIADHVDAAKEHLAIAKKLSSEGNEIDARKHLVAARDHSVAAHANNHSGVKGHVKSYASEKAWESTQKADRGLKAEREY